MVFFTAVATFSERVVAGMAWDSVLASRAASVPAMLLTGRACGRWRDWAMARLARRGHGDRRRALADAGVFMAFQVPVYAAILWVAGASLAEGVSAMALMALVGRPYGLFLDAVRRLFGLAPASGGVSPVVSGRHGERGFPLEDR
ncbi:MAG: L-alanine exporter AlaE [Paracoccaceae bacterium]